MKSNIALIGFMGTGKTTIGKKLASVLEKNFLEMDRVIEQRAGCTIPELFAESEELFRKYETQLCKDFYLYENYVISCGGGVILNPENVKILQKVANVILLTASADTIIQRTLKTRNSTRPLLITEDPHKTIQEMLRQRNPLYEKASYIKISTDNKSIDNIVNEILKKIKEKNDHE